ncbi:MAG: hypothetical protein QM778_34285 [Myxococcales bacterium]
MRKRILAFGLLSACTMSEPSQRSERPPLVQRVALGARVELQLTWCDGDVQLVRCLPVIIDAILEAEVDEPTFVVESTRDESGTSFIALRAQSPGQGTLHVRYRDIRGKEREVEAPLLALDPASVNVQVECETPVASIPVGAPTPNNVPALAAGSAFRVTASARTADQQYVSTGDLELVDFTPFEVRSQVDNSTQLTAPEEPGQYTWHTRTGEAVQVRVYGPLEQQLVLTPPESGRMLPHLVPTLGDQPACTPVGPVVVALEVLSGACQVGVGEVVSSQPLPLMLGPEGLDFEVYGEGECEIGARLGDPATGSRTSARMTKTAPRLTQHEGSPLGLAPVSINVFEPLPTAKCDKGITNGKCEVVGWGPFVVPDADCITDADWRIQPYDSQGPIDDHEFVGTQLTFSVELGVVVGPGKLLGTDTNGVTQGHRAPMDVTWKYDEQLFGLLSSPDDLHVEIGACVAPAGETRVAQVRIDSVGPQQIEFEASNLNDEGEFDFAARKVDRCPVHAKIDDEDVAGPSWKAFAGSSATLSARCERNDGLKLRGDAPLVVTSDRDGTGGTVTNNGGIYLGASRSSHLVAPTVGAGEQRIEVVGPEEVNAITLRGWVAAEEDPSLWCTSVATMDAESQAIHGSGDVRIELALDTEAGWAVAPESRLHEVCVRKVQPDARPARLEAKLGVGRAELELPQ